MGILHSSNYSSTEATNSTELFVIGKDFESYSGKNVSLLSGISTLGSYLYLSTNYTAAAVTGEGEIDYFLHYDMKLIIDNGILAVNMYFLSQINSTK